MVIAFDVAGLPGTFRWDNVTGKAELWAGDEYVELQNPWNPATHVSFTLTHTWRHTFGAHEIEIEKRRPLLLAGFRPNAFSVKVDGVVAAQANGL